MFTIPPHRVSTLTGTESSRITVIMQYIILVQATFMTLVVEICFQKSRSPGYMT